MNLLTHYPTEKQREIFNNFPLLHLSYSAKQDNFNVDLSIFFKAECIAHCNWQDRNDISSCANYLHTNIY